MTTEQTSSITLADGILTGPLRRSVNNSINAEGSIHDDATAAKLGFRGGTVAGSIHTDQYAALLVELYGQRWFERGALSLYFLNATVDGEAVTAAAEAHPGNLSNPIGVSMWADNGVQISA